VAPEWPEDAGWFMRLQASEHLWHVEPQTEKGDMPEMEAGTWGCMSDPQQVSSPGELISCI